MLELIVIVLAVILLIFLIDRITMPPPTKNILYLDNVLPGSAGDNLRHRSHANLKAGSDYRIAFTRSMGLTDFPNALVGKNRVAMGFPPNDCLGMETRWMLVSSYKPLRVGPRSMSLAPSKPLWMKAGSILLASCKSLRVKAGWMRVAARMTWSDLGMPLCALTGTTARRHISGILAWCAKGQMFRVDAPRNVADVLDLESLGDGSAVDDPSRDIRTCRLVAKPELPIASGFEIAGPEPAGRGLINVLREPFGSGYPGILSGHLSSLLRCWGPGATTPRPLLAALV